MSKEGMNRESLPVNEVVQVIDYTDIYHTDKWWMAVALVNMFGHTKIAIYQWKKDEKTGKWKRKAKFTLNFAKDWAAIKQAIDEKYINKIPEGYARQ